MARVLWIGDGGCTTGFGRVTHAVGERLVDQYGHDVHVLATNYRGDHWPTNLKLYVPTLLNGSDMYGQSRFVELLDKVEPDVVIILNDPIVVRKFLYRNNWDTEKVLLQYRPIIAYMPVDGTNSPPEWGILNKVTQPVVMAKHGWTLFPDAPLAYHGIDTNRFYPVSDERPMMSSGGYEVRSKADAKRALGFDPDIFFVLRVDRNSRRKDFASTWRALLPVMKRHTDIVAHFHCKAEGDDGVELFQLFSRDAETITRFKTPAYYSTHIGWNEQDLAILYNAADLFVSTSWGEGFGLTLGEAVACGVPVVAQNVSAIPEVVGPGGRLIEPAHLIGASQGQDQWFPDVDAFTEAIEHLYLAGGVRRKLGEAGVEHVRTNLNWDDAARVFDHQITVLAAGQEVAVAEAHG